MPTPPVARDDTAYTWENIPVEIDVLANDGDANNDPLGLPLGIVSSLVVAHKALGIYNTPAHGAILTIMLVIELPKQLTKVQTQLVAALIILYRLM